MLIKIVLIRHLFFLKVQIFPFMVVPDEMSMGGSIKRRNILWAVLLSTAMTSSSYPNTFVWDGPTVLVSQV